MPKFVTFARWHMEVGARTPVSIDPDEVSDIEDYCGKIQPGSLITLKNKKTYLVGGVHAEIVAKLSKKDSTG